MLYAFDPMLPKLLIADDSEAKQLMLEGFVRHNHWNVEILTSASTDEAKKLIDKNPDITFAFVDYEMPTEDGPAVIRYLKAKNSNARIALVSPRAIANAIHLRRQLRVRKGVFARRIRVIP